MSDSAPRILIAEDNVAAAGVLEFTLTRSGLQVEVATNGKAAITAVNERKFDAIITDYQMPHANGEEVIQAARASSLNQNASIVLCSAKGLELDVVELTAKYDLANVIYKPFSPREIVDIVWALPGVSTETCLA